MFIEHGYTVGHVLFGLNYTVM